jgi:hypothetical protein
MEVEESFNLEVRTLRAFESFISLELKIRDCIIGILLLGIERKWVAPMSCVLVNGRFDDVVESCLM